MSISLAIRPDVLDQVSERLERHVERTIADAAGNSVVVGWIRTELGDEVLGATHLDDLSDAAGDTVRAVFKLVALPGGSVAVDAIYRQSLLRVSTEFAPYDARCIGTVLPGDRINDRLLLACSHITATR